MSSTDGLCKLCFDSMYIHQMSSSIRLKKILNLTFEPNYADVVDFKHGIMLKACLLGRSLLSLIGTEHGAQHT